MPGDLFNWQRKDWPSFSFARGALKDELAAFARAFRAAKAALREPQDPLFVARTLAAEAVTTSAIEGVEVDEAVVMSSICRALGVPGAAPTAARDARSEGAARMVLAVREDWDAPLSAALLRRWHGTLLEGDDRGIRAGAFREVPVLSAALLRRWHGTLLEGDDRGIRAGAFREVPVRVVSVDRFGRSETRFEAPPPERVPDEIARFVRRWRHRPSTPEGIALKAVFLHPHFESIHPFEDGNGRIGRALVAKVLAEGLGRPVALPVSTFVARHRRAYYDELHTASLTLDWTSWAGFFVPVLTELLESFEPDREPIEPINDGINDGINAALLRLVRNHPGRGVPFFLASVKTSRATVERAVRALVRAGRIEHRGSRKTGGYFANSTAS